MYIDDLKVGTLTYTIQADDAQGEILESASEESPRTLMFGTGRVMKSFSDGLKGLRAGDAFAFTIPPDGAFGYHDECKITDLPIDLFMKDGVLREDLLQVGNTIFLAEKDGKPMQAKILEIEHDLVIVDLNHPLAGRSLFVKGRVIAVREPTIDEMNEALEYRKCHKGSCNHHHDHDCGHCH